MNADVRRCKHTLGAPARALSAFLCCRNLYAKHARAHTLGGVDVFVFFWGGGTRTRPDKHLHFKGLGALHRDGMEGGMKGAMGVGGGKHKSRGEGNNEQKKAQFNKKRFLLQKGPSCSPLTWTRRFNLMLTESSSRPPSSPFGGF